MRTIFIVRDLLASFAILFIATACVQTPSSEPKPVEITEAKCMQICTAVSIGGSVACDVASAAVCIVVTLPTFETTYPECLAAAVVACTAAGGGAEEACTAICAAVTTD